MLGKVERSQSFEVIDKKRDEGKKWMQIIECNEIPFTELILFIDVSSSSERFLLTLSCVGKQKNMKVAMQQQLGRSWIRSMILFLFLIGED
jgi:hypothetical protein